MFLLHNYLLDNCIIFITRFLVNMTWFTKGNIYKSSRRMQWLNLLCACNFNFYQYSFIHWEKSGRKEIIFYFILSLQHWMNLTFIFIQWPEPEVFFFTVVNKNTANSVASLGHTPRGERRKSFLPLVPGSSLGFILWPTNMGCEAYLEPFALVLGRKRLCLLSSNHYYTRLHYKELCLCSTPL